MQISLLPMAGLLAQIPVEKLPDTGAITEEISRLVAQGKSNFWPWFILGQLITIVAYWIASNVVAHAQGRFTNAIKLWVLYWISTLVIVAGSGAAIFYGTTQHSNGLIFAAVCVGALLQLAAVVGLPISVYKMSLGGSIGFLLITFILAVAANLGVGRFLAAPLDGPTLARVANEISALPPAEREKILNKFLGEKFGGKIGNADEFIAADRSKSIPERLAAIQRIYADLEARRLKLKTDDKASMDAYSRDEKRYQDLLLKLQADDAAAEQAEKAPR